MIINSIINCLNQSGLSVLIPVDEEFMISNKNNILKNFKNIKNYGVIFDDIKLRSELAFIKNTKML
ncbi:MAG: hypothetical protein GY756_15605 [bacterium]|nr:hypothetical protein [bacterium]